MSNLLGRGRELNNQEVLLALFSSCLIKYTEGEGVHANSRFEKILVTALLGEICFKSPGN